MQSEAKQSFRRIFDDHIAHPEEAHLVNMDRAKYHSKATTKFVANQAHQELEAEQATPAKAVLPCDSNYSSIFPPPPLPRLSFSLRSQSSVSMSPRGLSDCAILLRHRLVEDLLNAVPAAGIFTYLSVLYVWFGQQPSANFGPCIEMRCGRQCGLAIAAFGMHTTDYNAKPSDNPSTPEPSARGRSRSLHNRSNVRASPVALLLLHSLIG